MSDEMQLLNEIERARLARDVTDSPVYKEAFESYRERLLQQWADSPARDIEGRERLWLMLKTAETVQSHLAELMQTGKMAAVQLEQLRTRRERAAAMLRGVVNRFRS